MRETPVGGFFDWGLAGLYVLDVAPPLRSKPCRSTNIRRFHVKGKLRSLSPMVRATDTRIVALPPKVKDPIYNSPEFQMWRATVKQRAGYRCQYRDSHGNRCAKTSPEHRLYADHIVELRDGGSLIDPSNGQCLCASHHQDKTLSARVTRHRS